MLDKFKLIEAIREFNASARREWLEQFEPTQLRTYLAHLEYAHEPRGRTSRWLRPGDSPAVVTWSPT